jgi:hypothetical protein
VAINPPVIVRIAPSTPKLNAHPSPETLLRKYNLRAKSGTIIRASPAATPIIVLYKIILPP